MPVTVGRARLICAAMRGAPSREARLGPRRRKAGGKSVFRRPRSEGVE
jgi:hypothetical protein